jgi:hypothetical protein
MLDLEGASEDFVPELFRVLLSYAIKYVHTVLHTLSVC